MIRILVVGATTLMLLIAAGWGASGHDSDYCGTARDGWRIVTVYRGDWGPWHYYDHLWGPPPGFSRAHEGSWSWCPGR